MKKAKKKAKKKAAKKVQLSRWGLPKVVPVYYESPWPMSAATKKLYVKRAMLAAELDDLDRACEHWAQQDADQRFLDDGRLYREKKRLEKAFAVAAQKFDASYAIDEAKAMAGPVVDIVRRRRIANDHTARKRKKP